MIYEEEPINKKLSTHNYNHVPYQKTEHMALLHKNQEKVFQALVAIELATAGKQFQLVNSLWTHKGPAYAIEIHNKLYSICFKKYNYMLVALVLSSDTQLSRCTLPSVSSCISIAIYKPDTQLDS